MKLLETIAFVSGLTAVGEAANQYFYFCQKAYVHLLTKVLVWQLMRPEISAGNVTRNS